MTNRKGRTNNLNGRPKGVPNKVTKEIRPLLKEILEGELAKVPKLMEQLEAKDRVQAIIKLLEFVITKPTTDTETLEMAVKPFPNSTFDQFIENQIIQLEEDLIWKDKKLALNSPPLNSKG